MLVTNIVLYFVHNYFQTIPVVFIKIHISEEVTKEYLDTYDVQPEFLLDFEYKDSNPDQFSVFKTPLENRNVFHELE